MKLDQPAADDAAEFAETVVVDDISAEPGPATRAAAAPARPAPARQRIAAPRHRAKPAAGASATGLFAAATAAATAAVGTAGVVMARGERAQTARGASSSSADLSTPKTSAAGSPAKIHGNATPSQTAGDDSRTAYSASLVRFLLQAQFAATPADLVNLRSLGYEAWLDQQFSAPASEGGYDWMVSSGNTDPFKGEFFYPYFADFMIWKQLIASPDQMRQRFALALSEVFVVSTNALDAFWPGSFMGAYWDVLTKNAFGNFRTLLEDITLNAAMGRYLNTLGNEKEDPATGRLPDENYAREVMQLFTIGLIQLNPDGTPKLDASGRKIDTYTQSDVSNLARVFTGYVYDYTGVTYTNTPFQAYPIPSPQNARNRMRLDASKHSNLPATFLGVTVPANTPGALALKTALDTLFQHPNVGPFFARQMIQRLVISNPSPAYVQRVAAAFNNNGAGVRGDMKAFWKALLLDPEARTLSNAPSAGKVREPMVRAVQWARTFGATSVSGQWKVWDQSSGDYGLAQSPLRSPSVFNFYRPGYVPPRTAIANAGLVAPEFQIHNESSTVSYLNYMADWVGDTFGYGDIKPDYSVLLPLAANAGALVDWLNLFFSASQLSDQSARKIFSSLSGYPVQANSPIGTKLNRIHAAIAMVMACPQYIVQK
jgi:uncharacterized protein (DUF1800 family)